jgi:hypothetical protein
MLFAKYNVFAFIKCNIFAYEFYSGKAVNKQIFTPNQRETQEDKDKIGTNLRLKVSESAKEPTGITRDANMHYMHYRKNTKKTLKKHK